MIALIKKFLEILADIVLSIILTHFLSKTVT